VAVTGCLAEGKVSRETKTIEECMIDIETKDWLKDLFPGVVAVTREVGAVIMKICAEANSTVKYRRDNSPLTQADLASHHVIVEGPARITPEWPILSEESREIPYEQRSAWEYFWLVDPLDGTKEFLLRGGEFTVNVALIVRDRPMLGVIYAPAIGRIFFAGRGAGVWKADAEACTAMRVAKSAN